MSESPIQFHTEIYPPVSNLGEYEGRLDFHSTLLESGHQNKKRERQLVEIGYKLLDHCHFLEEKHDAWKNEHAASLTYHKDMKEEVLLLTEEVERQEKEIEKLKRKLETATGKAPSSDEDVSEEDEAQAKGGVKIQDEEDPMTDVETLKNKVIQDLNISEEVLLVLQHYDRDEDFGKEDDEDEGDKK